MSSVLRAGRRQHEELVAFASRFEPRYWAIEGATGTGALLAQQLVAVGETVLDVPPTLSARARLLDTARSTRPTRTTPAPRRSSQRTPSTRTERPRDVTGTCVWSCHPEVLYLVTCRHVAYGGASMARVVNAQGNAEIIDPEWIEHPLGDDVCIAPLEIAAHGTPGRYSSFHRSSFVPARTWSKRSDLSAPSSVPGDDTLIVGRFLGHDGGETNRPTARFGNIASAEVYAAVGWHDHQNPVSKEAGQLQFEERAFRAPRFRRRNREVCPFDLVGDGLVS